MECNICGKLTRVGENGFAPGKNYIRKTKEIPIAKGPIALGEERRRAIVQMLAIKGLNHGHVDNHNRQNRRRFQSN